MNMKTSICFYNDNKKRVIYDEEEIIHCKVNYE